MSDPVDTTDHGSDGIPQHAAPEEPGSVADETTTADITPAEPDPAVDAGDTGADEPRPEPVLDAGQLAGLVSGLVVAVVGVLLLVLAGNVLGNLDALSNGLTAIGVAFSALVAYVVPIWQARKARPKVTPLSDPRDADGNKLTPEGT